MLLHEARQLPSWLIFDVGQIMIPWNHITELRRRCADLKAVGEHTGVARLADEIVQILESHGVRGRELSTALNRVACARTELRDYRTAEKAARHALANYVEHEERNDPDQTLATHLWMVATTLAGQNKFLEAVRYGEEAVAIFSRALGEGYYFVRGRREALSEMRDQTWKG